MKKCAAFLSIMIIILLFAGCAPKVAAFSFSNLTVSPDEDITGSNITFSVEVTNTGNGAGDNSVPFIVDGVTLGSQDISLTPNASQSVSLTTTLDKSGLHSIEVGGLSRSFVVKKAAEFKISNLSTSRDQYAPGDDVVVKATVSNTGEVTGDYAIAFQMDDADVATKTGTLSAGDDNTLTFTVNPDEPGIHNISAAGQSTQFKILKPAEMQLSGLNVSPAEITAGQTATIMVDVANTGEAEGDFTVPLKVNGQDVDSQNITLAGGANETVSFSLGEDVGGVYNINIGDLDGVLTVQEGVLPVLHIGDQWVYRMNDDGSIYTRTETITGEEIVNGKDCYVVDVEYNPMYLGILQKETQWWEKDTLDEIMEQAVIESSGAQANLTVTITDTYNGSLWPVKVGNQVTTSTTSEIVAESGGQRKTDTTSVTTTATVDRIESVTVNAGTFRCFVIDSSSSDTGQATQWYSDKAKATVKSVTADGKSTEELLSYSVK